MKDKKIAGSMVKVHESEPMWSLKYRPSTFDDIILDDKTFNEIKGLTSNGKLMNFLFYGFTGGLGKTSIMYALKEDLKADAMMIDGSSENKPDTFRVEAKQFVTSVSPDFAVKMIAIDEADGLQLNTQKVLRGFVENYSKNTFYIMTCNYPELIMIQLRNRFASFDFDKIYNENKEEIIKKIYDRVKWILERENIEYEVDDLKKVVFNGYPSVRAIIILLQKFSSTGRLIVDSNSMNLANRNQLIAEAIKSKNFPLIKKLIQELDNISAFYSYIYDNLESLFVDKSIPYVVLECAKYQDMHTNARDKVICLSAFTVELMVNKKISMI